MSEVIWGSIAQAICRVFALLTMFGASSVRGLREAAVKLRAIWLGARQRRRSLRRGALAIGTLAIIGIGISVLFLATRQHPIPLEFLAVTLDDGRVVQSPAQLRRTSDGTDRTFAPCTTIAGLPVYRAAERIRIRFRSGNVGDWLSRLAPHFHVAVVVGADHAHVAPLPTPWSGAVAPGGTIDFEVQIAPSDQSLLILARRFSPFGVDRLNAELDRRLHGVKQSERLSVALSFLRGEAPSMLRYDFQVEEDKAGCRD
jgi:hypothetical protein